MDDSQIVELYLSRDESAITQTSQKYGSKLRRIARNVLSDTETSEECENDAYLRTWNLIPPNEPRTYLFAFVGKIVRHLAIDRLRHEGRQKRSALYCELTDEMQECIPGRSDVSQEYDAKELSESADSDYPAMAMYDGAVYKDSGEEFIGEVVEDNLLQFSSYTDGEPLEDGQQNFDRSSETRFFVLNEGAIVVLMDPDEGIWRIFLKQ